MPLFTLKDHVNTLAPLRPNEMLAVLHNLGNVRRAREPWHGLPRNIRRAFARWRARP